MESVAELLTANKADFAAFVLSFAVIARLWFLQHGTVRHLVAYDARIARLLVLWMLTVVFLPFPTGLVAEAPDEALTKVLYIGTILASTLLLALVEGVLTRHPELTDGSDDADPLEGLANAVVLLIALIISVAVPATSYLPLILLVWAGHLAEGWRRLRGRAAG